MTLRTTAITLSTVALCGALPAAAQTVTTMEAESMTLSSYSVESGARIKLASSTAQGTASKSFSGASGTYDVTVHVVAESDGQSTLQVFNGATQLGSTYTYPLRDGTASFTLSNVALNAGDTIKLVGTPKGGAWARVDKIVFTQKSVAAPSTGESTAPPIIGDAIGSVSPVTLEAEAMSLSSYAVENGTKIKLTATTGTAQKAFSGASGSWNMQVFVEGESDGTSKLSVYKGATKLRDYTYPQASGIHSFTVSNVALNTGDMIKLVGTKSSSTFARIDKVVLTRAATTPSEPVPSTPPSGSACANPSGGYEGFGRNTTGGAGKPVYRVTNLNDSGSGSLRDAISQGNRCVVFDVGGTINMAGTMSVRGANVTIDGFTAPAPGITLKNRPLVVQGSSGAGNVVVRGIRHHGTGSLDDDAMRIYNAANIVFDRVSVHGYYDGALDITEGSRDITVQYMLFGVGGEGALMNKPQLVARNAKRITLHHNLYFEGDYRNPRCAESSSTSEVVCDFRNNLVWNYGGDGTQVGSGGTANVVNNYYYTTKSTSAAKAIRIEGTPSGLYVSGNRSQNGWNLDGLGNRSTPYTAVVPTTSDALTAARQVVANAGARGPRFGLDQADQGVINKITLQ